MGDDAMYWLGLAGVSGGSALAGSMLNREHRIELAVVLSIATVLVYNELLWRKGGNPFRLKTDPHVFVTWFIVTFLAYRILSGGCH